MSIWTYFIQKNAQKKSLKRRLMKQLIFIKNLFDMKRDKLFEKIGDEIIENLTDNLFQDFEIEVGEKKVGVYIELTLDEDYFDKYTLSLFEIWNVENGINYKQISKRVEPIIEREIENMNIKAEDAWKSDDDTSRADYINFCREYY